MSNLPLIFPPLLRKGATIGLVAPASPPLEADQIPEVIARLRSQGFRVKAGRHLAERAVYLAGRDEDRAEDFQAAFADPEIEAVLALRGGYGSCRVLPLLDYAAIRAHPKPFIGYSDNTALHHAILKMSGLVTFHGPNATEAFLPVNAAYMHHALTDITPAEAMEKRAGHRDKVVSLDPPLLVKDLAAELGLRPYELIHRLMEMNTFTTANQALDEETARELCAKLGVTLEIRAGHSAPGDLLLFSGEGKNTADLKTLRAGRVRGRLLGGNMTCLLRLIGTPYQPDFQGAILFLEDIGEKAYRLDGMFTHLRLAGLLEQIGGLVLGRFTHGDEMERKRISDFLEAEAARIGVPCVSGAPIGHFPEQIILPHGAEAELDAELKTLTAFPS